jgi:uncharacterized protein
MAFVIAKNKALLDENSTRILHKDAGLSKLVSVGYEKHLIVDGSNILHAWPELRTLLQRDRDVAREKLTQSVRLIHDSEQVRLTLVFDGRGGDLVVESPGGQNTFAVVYTPAGTTADDVIEQLVGKAADPSACVVATDDRAERLTIEATGATGVSAEELRAWVARTEQRQQTRLAGRRGDNEKLWRQKS